MATKAEQETIIRWDEEERLVHVYSASPVIWRRLEREGFAVREETFHKGELRGRFYEPFPLSELTWRKKRPRTLTPEQREAARERILKLRASVNKQGSDELAGAGNAGA
jgi:hypothetical protein